MFCRVAPALDLKETKRPTIMGLRSPTSPMSLTPVPAAVSTLSPPVVGEFKGWFSNLFNWKAQQYLLYSTDNCLVTRNETARLLEGFGVLVVLEETQNLGTLRCRVDETQ